MDFERFYEFVKAEDEVTVCTRIADLLSKNPHQVRATDQRGVLAASCSAEHATVGSRRSHSLSGTASP
ncbi:hypothetical protein MRX96_023527 [Rhipicephalus microplus]